VLHNGVGVVPRDIARAWLVPRIDEATPINLENQQNAVYIF